MQLYPAEVQVHVVGVGSCRSRCRENGRSGGGKGRAEHAGIPTTAGDKPKHMSVVWPGTLVYLQYAYVRHTRVYVYVFFFLSSRVITIIPKSVAHPPVRPPPTVQSSTKRVLCRTRLFFFRTKFNRLFSSNDFLLRFISYFYCFRLFFPSIPSGVSECDFSLRSRSVRSSRPNEVIQWKTTPFFATMKKTTACRKQLLLLGLLAVVTFSVHFGSAQAQPRSAVGVSAPAAGGNRNICDTCACSPDNIAPVMVNCTCAKTKVSNVERKSYARV